MMPLLNLGFLLLISMTLFGGHYGAKRDSNTESRKPSLPPALRRHYFAARQNFHREPQVFDPYGGVAGPPPLPPPTANDYGRLKCSPIVRKCRRSPQPPADYPAADNNFPQSQSQWASASSSSSSSAYSTAPPPSPPAGPTNIAFQQQPQPQSAYQQQLAVPSQSSQLPSNYQLQLQQQQQQPAEPTNNNDIDNNYQQQPTAAVVAAATSAQQLGGYQPPAQAEEQQPQTPPSSPAPPQQSYGEKPAPPAAATDYQTPSPPAPPADYEPQPATTRRRQRAITRKAEAKLETAPQSEEKNRCRNEWLLARQRSGRSSDGLQNKTNDPQQAHSSHIHEGEILNGENKARTHGRRTQVQRVSPLDALIGPEYNTARQQQGRRGGRNRNNNRGRGQRGRPGQIPFPPAADEDSNNEWAQVNRLHNQQQQQHQQQQQLQQEQRYPIGPGQQKQPAASSRRPVGTGPVGPVGQFPTDGGLQQQHQQQGPPFLLGGRENNPGAAGGGVGVLIGPPKGGRQPTLISTNGGRLGHIPSSSSRNLPYVDDAHRYYYPPRMPLPLPTCFHNPTGYPCCNPTLNDLMVETYTELESKPKFHTCNINAIAQHLQMRAEDKFNTSFETVAAFDDFAQKIHFHGDLVCKVELGGKYMLAYATVKDAARVLPPESGDSGLLGSGASVDSGGGGQQQQQNYQRQSVTPPAPLGGRRKRNSELAFGPQLPLPLNDLSRRYSIWI